MDGNSTLSLQIRELGNSALETAWPLQCLAFTADEYRSIQALPKGKEKSKRLKEYPGWLFPVLDKRIPEFLENFVRFNGNLESAALDCLTRTHDGPVSIGTETDESFSLIAFGLAKHFYSSVTRRIELPEVISTDDFKADDVANRWHSLSSSSPLLWIHEWKSLEVGIRNEVLRASHSSGPKPDPQTVSHTCEVPSLGRIDVAILDLLEKRKGIAAIAEDFGDIASRKTVGERLAYLYKIEYVRHPEGSKRSWILTNLGIKRLNQLPAL